MTDAPFRTPVEALEHIVIILERGERVPYWAIDGARAVLDDTRATPSMWGPSWSPPSRSPHE